MFLGLATCRDHPTTLLMRLLATFTLCGYQIVSIIVSALHKKQLPMESLLVAPNHQQITFTTDLDFGLFLQAFEEKNQFYKSFHRVRSNKLVTDGNQIWA